MNITAAKYANASGGILLVRDNGVDLYVDSGELYDRAKAGDFGSLGGPPAAEPEAAPVPQVVSRFQGRAALREAGYRDQIDAIMADPATDPLMVDAWNDAQEFRRSSSTVAAIGAVIGLTEEELDDLFKTAINIEA